MDNGLFNIFIFLAAACVVVPLASRFKLGSVLGYLAAGVIIGPFGLGLMGDTTKIMHFAEFGVVMMLFIIGLELEPASLWRLRKAIVGLGGLQVLLTSAAFTAIGMAFGYSWQLSLAAGMALSLSSTALVLQMLQEARLMDTTIGETAFAVLLFQDIVVIPILVIMPLLARHGVPAAIQNHANLIASLPGWLQALVVTAVIAGVVVAGRYLSHYLFREVARTRLREVFTALSLAMVVGITLLMQSVGVSPALGAFVAGVVLANSEYRHVLQTDIEPFKGLLLGLFFISVGMGMDFGLFAEQPLRLGVTIGLLITVKGLLLFILARLFGLNGLNGLGVAFALAQGGEFAFVLFQFAGGLAILPAAQAHLLTLAVATSIAITPVLMLVYSRFIMPRFMSVLPEQNYDRFAEGNAIIIAGFGRFGQVIGRFLTAQGIKATVLEKDPDQIELLRKFGFKGYFGDASRLDLLHSAGAAKASLLVVAVDDPETSVAIVKLAKAEFPQLKIFARAHNRRHAYELDKAGVDYYKREIFDSSLAMAQHIMVTLGNSAEEMRIKAAQFRDYDDTALKASFAFFDNESALVNFARIQRTELERILQDDAAEDGQ
ncbi:monovalent cation:proton antiporter-2 (CPA2) family protein [Methylovulum psychrotolerans]|uniref:Potassium transporter n=1 Tax=Methylovulum psychrotolerans TaxID=1704499 RepID=A0A1Z4C315_9GAMM|nr:monovalent cation:proton antiporter-2 (CPA2) family protein [Methylovulum psychrotolerans]ASF47904.1 potassium transporter [Methylovulum psychrotolerans]